MPASLHSRPIFRSKKLVGAAAAEDGAGGLEEDLGVEGESPVLDVAQVEADGLLPGQVAAAGDLPEAGHAGLDQQAALGVALVTGDLAGKRGPGPDQRHGAA